MHRGRSRTTIIPRSGFLGSTETEVGQPTVDAFQDLSRVFLGISEQKRLKQVRELEQDKFELEKKTSQEAAGAITEFFDMFGQATSPRPTDVPKLGEQGQQQVIRTPGGADDRILTETLPPEMSEVEALQSILPQLAEKFPLGIQDALKSPGLQALTQRLGGQEPLARIRAEAEAKSFGRTKGELDAQRDALGSGGISPFDPRDDALTSDMREFGATLTEKQRRSMTRKELATGFGDFIKNKSVDKRDFATKMGNTFQSIPIVKTLQEMGQSVARVNAVFDQSGKSRTGSATVDDTALILLFNRMLEPTSAVLPGEYVRLQDQLDIMSSVKARIARLGVGGAVISDRERTGIVQMVKNFNEAMLVKVSDSVDWMREIAKEENVKLSLMVPKGIRDRLAEPRIKRMIQLSRALRKRGVGKSVVPIQTVVPAKTGGK